MVDDISTTIFKGDDSDAFGRNLIRVNAPKGIEEGLISKCIFQCGCYQQVIDTPTFPFYLNIPSEGSKKLSYANECYLQLFDKEGKRITLKGNLTILAEKQVVSDCQNSSTENGVKRYVK